MPPLRNVPPSRDEPASYPISYKPCSSVRLNADITPRPASPNKHRTPSHNSKHLESFQESPFFEDLMVPCTVKLGIAIYKKHVPGSKPGANKFMPLWCLVSHPTSLENLDAPGIKQVGIRRVLSSDPEASRRDFEGMKDPEEYSWKLLEPLDPLFEDDFANCLGVVQIADIPWSPRLLNSVLDSFTDANKGNDDPGEFRIWSPAAWVIRAMAHLEGLLLVTGGKNFLKYRHRAFVNVDAHASFECGKSLILRRSPKVIHSLVTTHIAVLEKMKNEKKRRSGRVPVVDLYSADFPSSASSSSSIASPSPRRAYNAPTCGSPSRSVSRSERAYNTTPYGSPSRNGSRSERTLQPKSAIGPSS